DEQALAEALLWLQSNTATKGATARTMLQALTSGKTTDDASAVARMSLTKPSGFKQRLMQRMLKLALQRTR
ncbi:MAG: hypothetical protein ACR2QT_07505, partial [Woeseiaceae bacterium]